MKLLDKAFRETLDKIAEMQFRSSVLSEIRQKLVQGHEIVRPCSAGHAAAPHASMG